MRIRHESRPKIQRLEHLAGFPWVQILMNVFSDSQAKKTTFMLDPKKRKLNAFLRILQHEQHGVKPPDTSPCEVEEGKIGEFPSKERSIALS
ncbi:unnamed protein product [Malus baccata var. baccata]